MSPASQLTRRNLRFASRFLSVAMPKLFNGAVMVGLNLFLMRHLPSEELAILSMCLSVVLLVDAVAGSAIDLGTIKLGSSPELPDETRLEVQKHGVYAKLIAAAIALVIVAAGNGPIWFAFTHRSQGGHLLYLTCFAALGLLLVRSAQVQMQLAGQFRAYGALDLAHVTLRIAGLAICAWLNALSPATVLLCYAAAPLVVTLAWLALQGRKLFPSLRARGEIFGLIGSNVSWLLITFGTASLLSRMDLFMVSRWSNLGEAGIYAGAQSVALVPQMLGLYLSVILGPKIMPLLAEKKFYGFFRNVQTALVALSAVCGLGFVLVWPFIGPLILPPHYARSSDVIRAMMPGAFAGLVTFPLTLSFLMYVRPRFLFSVDCVSLPLMIVFYYYSIRAYGAVGAAWTSTAAAVFRAAIAQFFAWRFAHQSGIGSGPVPVIVEPAEVMRV